MIFAGEVAFEKAVAGDEVLDIEVGGAGGRFAPACVTERTGKVGGVTDNDVAGFACLNGSGNKSIRNAPVRRGFELFDLGVVDIIVTVGVKRNFGNELVPSEDVKLPPFVEDILGGLVVAASFGNGGVVNHCHGKEVHTEFVFDPVDGGEGDALVILFDHVDGHFGADGFINGSEVLVLGRRVHIGFAARSRRSLRRLRGGCRRIIGILIAGNSQRKNDQKRKHKCKDSESLHCKIPPLKNLYTSVIVTPIYLF